MSINGGCDEPTTIKGQEPNQSIKVSPQLNLMKNGESWIPFWNIAWEAHGITWKKKQTLVMAIPGIVIADTN